MRLLASPRSQDPLLPFKYSSRFADIKWMRTDSFHADFSRTSCPRESREIRKRKWKLVESEWHRDGISPLPLSPEQRAPYALYLLTRIMSTLWNDWFCLWLSCSVRIFNDIFLEFSPSAQSSVFFFVAAFFFFFFVFIIVSLAADFPNCFSTIKPVTGFSFVFPMNDSGGRLCRLWESVASDGWFGFYSDRFLFRKCSLSLSCFRRKKMNRQKWMPNARELTNPLCIITLRDLSLRWIKILEWSRRWVTRETFLPL